MKKGFTLVELVAVIVVLALVILVAFPAITGIMGDSKERAYKEQVSLIEDAARRWGSANNDRLSENEVVKVNVETLIREGYISNENSTVLKDPTDNSKNMNGCVEIKYNTINNQYEYKYNDKCSNEFYTDNSGANEPELYVNMIPIVYDGTNWKYADLTSKWYDYNNKEWANAVVLNSGVTKNVGDYIVVDDIALWYVWIPRYKYKLFNVNDQSKEPQVIDITFESGTATTGTVSCTDVNFVANPTSEVSEICTNAVNGNWYTHPAFTFGDKELKGFWMGKFELSTSDETCRTTTNSANCNKELTPTILPGVNTWRYATISNFYNSIKKISTTYGIGNADSHMIKNMEWGAVAYLKQSKYGLGLTDIIYNPYSVSVSDRRSGCGYRNADNIDQYYCAPYNSYDGMFASTTGNAYGVYDMSGGSYDYTMAGIVDANGAFYASSSGFTTEPEAKYYDKYVYSSTAINHKRGKLGDATKEVAKIYGNASGNWYGDQSYFPYSTTSWFVRGGLYSQAEPAGVFAHYRLAGAAAATSTTRAILVAK